MVKRACDVVWDVWGHVTNAYGAQQAGQRCCVGLEHALEIEPRKLLVQSHQLLMGTETAPTLFSHASLPLFSQLNCSNIAHSSLS